MDKWEYQVVYPVTTREYGNIDVSATERQLNALGEQGWELAGIINDTSGHISTPGHVGVTSGTIRTSVNLLFKRRKS